MIFIYIRNILHRFFRTGFIGPDNGIAIESGGAVTRILQNPDIKRGFPCNHRPDGYYSLSMRPEKDDAARKNRDFMPQASTGSKVTLCQIY